MSTFSSHFASDSYRILRLFFFFFFNDTPPTEIYTLSLHDALPICVRAVDRVVAAKRAVASDRRVEVPVDGAAVGVRSEEHTSELQSHSDLVCRLLLEKKKKKNKRIKTRENNEEQIVHTCID